MKSLKLYYFILLFVFGFTSIQAQCYQRISLVGGGSVRVIPKTVVNQPKDKEEYKKPWSSIQFQRRGTLISIRVIEINKDSYLNKLDDSNYPKALIEYTRSHYAPIDSTCIAFDTLQIGQIQKQYPFVDLLETTEFYNASSDCKEEQSNYSSLKERLLRVDKYVYILSVQAVQNCQAKENALNTRKAVKVDFRRLIRSLRTPKPLTTPIK